MNKPFQSLRAMQDEDIDTGQLQVHVTTELDSHPIPGAMVKISYSGDPASTIEELATDSSGLTDKVSLNAPPVELSLSETNERQPYSEYTIEVSAPGYETVQINGTEILATVTALQDIHLQPSAQVQEEAFVIPPHTLFGDYPPKISEDEIKPINESGEIVLSRVVIPEFIIVHDGPPSDAGARNHYVRFKDYIKNVASSEIYATWPANTIRANTLAIMSFTLNRVYTEWYRNRGYDYTITSSTAYDQKWIQERNIYDTISNAVDELFTNYLSRPDVRQPILTQYCDGRKVSCPNWMTQWGSKTLGEQGYSTIDILRNYYGSDMYINTAEEISGVPSSWPGTNLTIGSTGPKVQQMQEQLNVIAGAYPALPKITADGIYGQATANAVRTFQEIFNLPATGVVDFQTWYRISGIYVAVSRIAEFM